MIFADENRRSGAADIAGIVSISRAILARFGYRVDSLRVEAD